jgi:osmotically-inducible protein OsmY
MKVLVSLVTAGAIAGSALLVSGCFPLAATGLVAGALSASDRRTIGAQAEDAAIEFKASSQLRDAVKFPGGISVTSYNRKVLLTGQVGSDEDRRTAERIVSRIDNVRSVENALQIAGQPALTASASDAAVSTGVKAALIENSDTSGLNTKVVTESGVVYLMGIVSRKEADRASQVASRVRGVQKVVTVFEVVSDEELARILKTQGSK